MRRPCGLSKIWLETLAHEDFEILIFFFLFFYHQGGGEVMPQRWFLGNSKRDFPPSHQLQLCSVGVKVQYPGRLQGQEERLEKGTERQGLVGSNESTRAKASKGRAGGEEMPLLPGQCLLPARQSPAPRDGCTGWKVAAGKARAFIVTTFVSFK